MSCHLKTLHYYFNKKNGIIIYGQFTQGWMLSQKETWEFYWVMIRLQLNCMCLTKILINIHWLIKTVDIALIKKIMHMNKFFSFIFPFHLGLRITRLK